MIDPALLEPLIADRGYRPGDEDRIRAWITREIGTITQMERQPRWRPAWFVTAKRPDGSQVPLYVRGARGSPFPPHSVSFEHRVHGVLARHGMPIPRQYGFCSDPPAIIMEAIECRTVLREEPDPAVRAEVLAGYMQALHDMYRIPLDDWRAAGIRVPEERADLILNYFDDNYRSYLALKQRPDPFIAFINRWMRRNVPDRATGAGFVTGDAGQLMFWGREFRAIFDFECGFISDPLMDLATMRVRDLVYPLDEWERVVAAFEAGTGIPVDYGLLRFYTVVCASSTILSVPHILADPPADSDFTEYASWYYGSLRQVLEAIGEYVGQPLAAPASALTGRPSRLAGAITALGDAGPMPEPGSFARYKAVTREALRRFVALNDAHQAAIERDYLDLVAAVTGRRTEDWAEADTVLEAFIETDDGSADARLLPGLHRHASRYCALLAADTREYWDYLMKPLAPVGPAP